MLYKDNIIKEHNLIEKLCLNKIRLSYFIIISLRIALIESIDILKI